MTHCILAPDSLSLLVWKLPANYKQFTEQIFENQQNRSLRALFSNCLIFTEAFKLRHQHHQDVPRKSCFSQQQFWCNGKSLVPWHPSTGAEDQQHRQENTSVSSSEGLLSWLAKSTAAPDAGAVPFFSRKEAFTRLWTRYLANCHGTHLHNGHSGMRVSTLPTKEGGWFPAFLKRFKAELLALVPMKYKKPYFEVSAYVLTWKPKETTGQRLKGTLAVICYSITRVISCKRKGRTNWPKDKV